MTESTDVADVRSVAGERLPRRHRAPQWLEVGAIWGWRFLVVVASVLVAGWLFAQLRVVVIPLFVAVVLAALLMPLVDLIDRFLPRLLAVWLVLLVAVGVTAIVVYLLQSPVRAAAGELADSWDATRDDLERWLRTGPLGLSQSRIDELAARGAELPSTLTTGLFGGPAGAARMAAEVVGGFFLAFVLTFFFVKDGRTMWRWGLDRISPLRRSALDRAGPAAFAALQGWIRGIAITGLVDGALIGGALLVLGVPAAIPLAVITFFASFFPIVGATLAGALAAAIALAAEGPQTALIVVGVVLVVQQVEGDILMPVVMNRQLALHPVAILLALAIGAAIGGILGAIMSVPLTAAAVAAVAAARSPDSETANDADGDTPQSSDTHDSEAVGGPDRASS